MPSAAFGMGAAAPPPLQNDLAAIKDKLLVAPATEAKQDDILTALSSIEGKLDDIIAALITIDSTLNGTLSVTVVP